MNLKTGIAIGALIAATSTAAFAQAGADTYKAKCSMCHGAQGTPNPGIAKNMGVKPISDPAVKALSAAQMIAITTNGKAKMPAFKGKLTDTQIKASVDYFRSLGK